MIRNIFLLLFCAVFINCGREHAYIAEKVKYRVFFNEQSTQVSLVLAPAYQIKSNSKIKFSDIGSTFTKWNEATQESEIGSRVFSLPEVVGKPRGKLISKLPGNKSFPSVVSASEIFLLAETQNELETYLTYHDEEDLVIGGGLSHKQFSKLPQNFFATQKFYSSNGDTEATISILGPTKDSKGSTFSGGIFFFGNFGMNPFKSGISFHESEKSITPEWETYELIAKDPIVIHSRGIESSNYLSSFKIEDFMSELNAELQKMAVTGSAE